MDETKAGTSRLPRGIVLSGTLIAAITFAVFLPSLQSGFLTWDDPIYVYNNTAIRSLDLKFFKWAFTASVVGTWQPLTNLSFAVDYAIWGLNPLGYHLANNVFHALNTFLVAVLTFMLFKAAERQDANRKTFNGGAHLASIVTAALFGLHPLHVESVSWVAERKDVLCGFFFLISLIFYLRYASDAGRRTANYLVMLAAFVLALMSKPMAVSLPLVFLIIDFYPLRRTGLKNFKIVIIEKIPLLLLCIGSVFVTLASQEVAVTTTDIIAFKLRFFVAARAYIFYLYKMIAPFKLAPLYPHPVNFNVFTLEYAGALALFMAISVVSITLVKRSRLFPALWFYYVITLLPVIGLVQIGLHNAADRYTYLPSLSPFFLVGLGAGRLTVKYGRKGLIASAAVTVALIAVMAGLTIRQERIWKNSVVFWTYELNYLDSMPENMGYTTINGVEYQNVSRKLLPYFNRGLAYDERGEYRKAIEDYTRVLEINPDYIMALVNRGNSYGRLGELDRAIKNYNMAIVIDPGNPEPYYNRGIAHMVLGDYERASRDFQTAERLK